MRRLTGEGAGRVTSSTREEPRNNNIYVFIRNKKEIYILFMHSSAKFLELIHAKFIPGS